MVIFLYVIWISIDYVDMVYWNGKKVYRIKVGKRIVSFGSFCCFLFLKWILDFFKYLIKFNDDMFNLV